MSRHQIDQLPQKTRLTFPAQKNVQRKVLTVTKNIQKNLLEAEKLGRRNPTLLQLPLSETT